MVDTCLYSLCTDLAHHLQSGQMNKNPFKKENPFSATTVSERIAQAIREAEESERQRLDELEIAAKMDPENKHGLW
jgi:UDP-N-acetylglucosamine 2-epimerase